MNKRIECCHYEQLVYYIYTDISHIVIVCLKIAGKKEVFEIGVKEVTLNVIEFVFHIVEHVADWFGTSALLIDLEFLRFFGHFFFFGLDLSFANSQLIFLGLELRLALEHCFFLGNDQFLEILGEFPPPLEFVCLCDEDFLFFLNLAFCLVSARSLSLSARSLALSLSLSSSTALLAEYLFKEQVSVT